MCNAVKPQPVRKRNLLKRARAGDRAALETMFRQFLDPAENVMHADYLGVLGFWGIGTRCFGCVTDRRVCSLKVGFLGKVIYQDGYLEDSNSNMVLQPGLWGLVVMTLLFLLANTALPLAVSRVLYEEYYRHPVYQIGIPAAFFLGGLMLLPLLVQLFYRFNKSGLVWVIREGIAVYFFTNRKRMSHAARIYRVSGDIREHRIQYLRRAADRQLPRPEFQEEPSHASSETATPGPHPRRASLRTVMLIWILAGAGFGAARCGLDFALVRAGEFAYNRNWYDAGDLIYDVEDWLAFPAPAIWEKTFRDRLIIKLADLRDNRGVDFIQEQAATNIIDGLRNRMDVDVWDLLFENFPDDWAYIADKYPNLIEELLPPSETKRIYFSWLFWPTLGFAFCGMFIHVIARLR